MTFSLPTDVASRPVAVIGAGTLGRRIALIFATRGGVVSIFDPSPEARESAVAYVRETLPELIARLDGGAAGSIVSASDLPAAVADAWLVVEAVPERLELKREVFAELDRAAAPDAVLASNSSSMPSRLFLDHVTTPERVLNMHFYMLPDQRAVDLMSCGATDPRLIGFMKERLADFGLAGFEARRESFGFIFNRVWAAIKRECLDIVAQGVAEPADVDGMWMLNTGLSIGPFQGMDMIGLDVVLDIERAYAAQNPGLPKGPRELLTRYVDAGRLGVKTGRGFYEYRDGQQVPGDV